MDYTGTKWRTPSGKIIEIIELSPWGYKYTFDGEEKKGVILAANNRELRKQIKLEKLTEITE